MRRGMIKNKMAQDRKEVNMTWSGSGVKEMQVDQGALVD